MAKLYFHYGAMNSGKSIALLKAAHNYEEQGKDVMAYVPVSANRKGEGVIESRIGIRRNAHGIEPTTNMYRSIFDKISQSPKHKIYCVFIDEAQFLTHEQVEQLAQVVDHLDTPVMAYGLKNDFQNKLFEGSAALLLFADKLREEKAICTLCGRKATMNLRLSDGEPVYDGDQIQIGGNESYMAMCRKHYFSPKGIRG